jgi:hypothetical protein
MPPATTHALLQNLPSTHRFTTSEMLKTAEAIEPTVKGSKGRTSDKVAAAFGRSGKTYEKARVVVEAAEADPERFGDIGTRHYHHLPIQLAHRCSSLLPP